MFSWVGHDLVTSSILIMLYSLLLWPHKNNKLFHGIQFCKAIHIFRKGTHIEKILPIRLACRQTWEAFS